MIRFVNTYVGFFDKNFNFVKK